MHFRDEGCILRPIEDECSSRKAIFQESLGRIAAYPSGRSWKAGVNAFSDLTWDEFKATKLKFHFPKPGPIEGESARKNFNLWC